MTAAPCHPLRATATHVAALAQRWDFAHEANLMTQAADFTLNPGESGDTLVFTGPLTVATIGALDPRLRDLGDTIKRIDLGEVRTIDTVGAWVCCRLSRETGAEIVNPCESAARLIKALQRVDDGQEPAPRRRLPTWLRVPEHIGDTITDLGRGAVNVLGFVGQMTLAMIHLARHPSEIRVKPLIHQMELVGVNALGIVGLMSFLVGIVIAQQGATQLRQFGAEIYTVNLVGRLTLRELGVLMTAIMVAGRSGSAFAAELGTMKLTEEVDAMRTIGVAPMEALILPRVLATVLMLPLLGVYSAVLGIIGGAVLAQFALDMPPLSFVLRIRDVVPVYDVWVGLVKGPVFGLIVAIAGCYQGMQVRSNAEEVGTRTTAAVVLAIFSVIVLDAFFAIFFTEVGWG
jgi:phospholipid/cholesterol/gamma-HCH transport system permease protein